MMPRPADTGHRRVAALPHYLPAVLIASRKTSADWAPTNSIVSLTTIFGTPEMLYFWIMSGNSLTSIQSAVMSG